MGKSIGDIQSTLPEPPGDLIIRIWIHRQECTDVWQPNGRELSGPANQHAKLQRAEAGAAPLAERSSERLARFRYESQPVVFTEWRQSHVGRLRLTFFHHKLQTVEIGDKLLFGLLADQPLGYLEEAAELSLGT